MAETTPRASRRLDSWKEIAEYLGRDSRTAMRWAKSQGLPVRRVAGDKGRSVFAFRDEIDEWLKGRSLPGDLPGPPSPAASNDGPPALLKPALATSDAPPRNRRSLIQTAVVAVILVAVLGAIKPGWTGGADAGGFTVAVDALGVRITMENGAVRTIHNFDQQAGVVIAPYDDTKAFATDLDADGETDILVGTASQRGVVDDTIRSGRLLRLNRAGEVHWTFTFDDAVRFGGETYSSPWGLIDWRPSPGFGRRRIAVIAHHYTWWPSIVAILDDAGNRLGSFVNAGWVERIVWLDADRLVIAGFNNPLDGGMLGVLDARRLRGHSPDGDPPYVCESCGDGDPARYFVFHRSELNALTGGRFNRAVMEVMPDRVVAQTEELHSDTVSGAVAIYQFDRDLRFLSASYSDQYWEMHRRLEKEGRLAHSRKTCPERDGPPSISSWSRERGWERITPIKGG